MLALGRLRTSSYYPVSHLRHSPDYRLTSREGTRTVEWIRGETVVASNYVRIQSHLLATVALNVTRRSRSANWSNPVVGPAFHRVDDAVAVPSNNSIGVFV